ncbi:hypothetical protein BKA70DRAFT_1233057 [Coprinopsis sp. MPI-PUGE-AT-0042]|nr:hypothetical protein BKA70DRAFT_1233057 [Coprinopsis sp. MPI-PUGE-AT-0042]
MTFDQAPTSKHASHLSSTCVNCQHNSSRLSPTQPSTNIRLQPSALPSYSPAGHLSQQRPAATIQELPLVGSICIEDGVRLGRNSRRELARRLVPTPLRSQKVPTKHQVHYVQSMGYRWYSPQLIVRHWQVTIAPQRRATIKIPPVRSIDVQACEILFMRHMVSSVDMALALAHRLVALFAISASTLPPSPRLLNIPPGTTWLPRPSGPLPPSLVYLARLVHLVSGFAPDLVPHVELRFSMPTTDVLLNPSRNEDSRNPSTKSTYPILIQLLLAGPTICPRPAFSPPLLWTTRPDLDLGCVRVQDCFATTALPFARFLQCADRLLPYIALEDLAVSSPPRPKRHSQRSATFLRLNWWTTSKFATGGKVLMRFSSVSRSLDSMEITPPTVTVSHVANAAGKARRALYGPDKGPENLLGPAAPYKVPCVGRSRPPAPHWPWPSTAKQGDASMHRLDLV